MPNAGETHKNMIDKGREYDLEELVKAKKQAKSQTERDHYDRIMYRIINQSTAITSLRNEMIEALRVNDTRKVKRIQQHIQAVRLEETRGTSWGQNKQENKLI